MPKMEHAGRMRQISLTQITANSNVRTDYTEIQELAESIKTVGLIEPIAVKPLGKDSDGLDKYELIAGFRRYKACNYLLEKGENFSMIDAVIVTGDKLTLQLVENLQRTDLSARDRENGIYQLAQTGLSKKDIAARLSKNEPYVYRNLAAQKIRSLIEKEAVSEIEKYKKIKAALINPDEAQESQAQKAIENAEKWLNDVYDLPTQVLCEIQSVNKEHIVAISQRLINSGGTLSAARQLVKDLNESPDKIKASVEFNDFPENSPENEYDIDPFSSIPGDKKPTSADSSIISINDSSSKLSNQRHEKRVLEEPPHKKVNLNDVQLVIKDYIDKLSKFEDAGSIFEYKTDAAYEIWSLLLAKLSGF